MSFGNMKAIFLAVIILIIQSISQTVLADATWFDKNVCESQASHLTPHLDFARTGKDETGMKFYHFGLCPRNVWLMSQYLLRSGLSLENSKVLFIDHRDGQQIKPMRPRSAPKKIVTPNGQWIDFNWNGMFGFHVVLEVDGLILDLDFDEFARVIPASVYFKEMFELDPNLRVHLVPAEEYSSADRIIHSEYMNGKFPAMSIEHYLGERKAEVSCL